MTHAMGRMPKKNAQKGQAVGTATIPTVNARDLHEFLESRKQFGNWVSERIRKCNFTEGVDFIKFNCLVKSDSKARTEYHLTLDMAKELAMVACCEWAKAGENRFTRDRVEPGSTLSPTNHEMAEAANVSVKTIQQAKVAHAAGLVKKLWLISHKINRSSIENGGNYQAD
ncbi:MAG: antA/AntB antirepressor family protein [Desulfobulbaceae bacterium]|nr:antA/AntB antirepressor family protein [Desulfobulbaceae bacterium]